MRSGHTFVIISPAPWSPCVSEVDYGIVTGRVLHTSKSYNKRSALTGLTSDATPHFIDKAGFVWYSTVTILIGGATQLPY